MKASTVRRVVAASLAAAALAASVPRAAAADPPPSPALLDLMAQGKAETDLGHYAEAIRALAAVAEAPDASPAFRLEALVRLGVARRSAGDFEGALQAFQRAARSPALDADRKALLVQALGGAMPGARRWADVWSRVRFAEDRSQSGRPTLTVVWPDDGARPSERGDTASIRGDTVSILFTDADLGDVFRLVADISFLNVVVFPGVHGKVSLEAHDEPWERILDKALTPNGLVSQRTDNVLLIAPPDRMPPERTFKGRRVDLKFQDSELRKTLAEIASLGRATVDLDPAVAGEVTIRLSNVRWDQAFDIIARVNGLDWTEDGTELKVFPAR